MIHKRRMQHNPPTYHARFYNPAVLLFYRYIARKLPAKWFRPPLPDIPKNTSNREQLSIEIVSHCWKYSHLMAYQLSSYVINPPSNTRVIVTIYYSPEDRDARELLDFFEKIEVPNVKWNWREIDKSFLFRRAIGRNRAALNTTADWVWYADCDLIFASNVIDNVAEELKSCEARLAFPSHEYITPLLAQGDPRLREGIAPEIIDIDKGDFDRREINRAVGAFQLVRGDLLRSAGYCNSIRLFQTPSERWLKTYEDTVFRWLIETDGERLNAGGTYRIRHQEKGRYKDDSLLTRARKAMRAAQRYS